MRIEVSGSVALEGGDLRAYAEYRVFSRLAAFAGQVNIVRIVISRPTDDRPTSCTMSASLSRGGCVWARSRGRQPIRAVDSAATKLAEATRAQLAASDGTRPYPAGK